MLNDLNKINSYPSMNILENILKIYLILLIVILVLNFELDETITVSELDKDTTEDEVISANKGLKYDTSASLDRIMAEVFKFNCDIFGNDL